MTPTNELCVQAVRFSKFGLRPVLIRRYGTSAVRSYPDLWFKLDGSETAISVNTHGCKKIQDIVVQIKKMSSPDLDKTSLKDLKIFGYNQTSPFPLDRKLSDIEEQLKASASAGRPLLVKIMPEGKRIKIQEVSSEGQGLDFFHDFLVTPDMSIKDLVGRKADGLYPIHSPKNIITKVSQLEQGEKYAVYSRYFTTWMDEERWTQKEDKAVEDEVYFAVEAAFQDYGFKRLTRLDRELKILGEKKVPLKMQQWEGVIQTPGMTILFEYKHYMSFDQLEIINKKVEIFRELVKKHPKELGHYIRNSDDKVLVVAAGVLFPLEVRTKAKKRGYAVCYTSGGRFRLEGLDEF